MGAGGDEQSRLLWVCAAHQADSQYIRHRTDAQRAKKLYLEPSSPPFTIAMASEQKHAAGLMRVNHTGEICAQALYEGQALTASDPKTRDALKSAASEETDHLAWCEERLDELNSRPSVLNPAFYALSYAMGALTGLMGDRISLGFVEATEDQVCKHLANHLETLPEADDRSREIVKKMHDDESR